MSTLPVETWLGLLDQSTPSMLTLICTAMQEHVAAERLNNEQVIALACARPVPVARMGLQMLRRRHKQRPFTSDELTRLAACQCESVAGEVATWALGEIGRPNSYNVEQVIEFFDSSQEPARLAALDWVELEDSPGYNDAVLWARLVETPFDDVKLRLVESLESRLKLPGRDPKELSQLWGAVILGVHRGGRTKLKAIRQLADSITADPGTAENLLPVLAVALRSVRAPERRQTLSAIATMVARNGNIREKLGGTLRTLSGLMNQRSQSREGRHALSRSERACRTTVAATESCRWHPTSLATPLLLTLD